MKNKKLSFLSLFLAISFAFLPIHAQESNWKRYFSWLAIGSLWGGFKDTVRPYIFNNKAFNEWAPEVVSMAMGHAATQIIASGIISASIHAWQQTGGRLWRYWELKKSFKQTKPVDEEEPKVKLDWEQLLLTDQLLELKDEILNPKKYGNWSRGAFIYGLPGNGKTELINLLARTAQQTEDQEDGAAYVRLFSGNMFKALLGENGNVAGEAFKVGVNQLSHNTKHKKKPKIVILDEVNQLLGGEDSADNSVRGSMYDGALESIPRGRGGISFLVVGNYDIAPPIKSRISRIIVMPHPSIKDGLAKYNEFFTFMDERKFDNSSIQEGFIDKCFREKLKYQHLFPWLDMPGLEIQWPEAKLLRESFGVDKSILSIFAWTQIAENVHTKVCRSNSTIITQKMFTEAMDEQLNQSIGILHPLVIKKMPKNIEPIIHKKVPKLTPSTEWPPNQSRYVPAKVPQIALTTNDNNNPSVTTIGLPSLPSLNTDSLSTVEGNK